MSEIEIHDAVDADHAKRVYEHFLGALVMPEGTNDEVYYSPDMKAALALRERDELPWSFRVFAAKVRALKSDATLGACLHRLWFRRFLSPGAFGCGYDHWSGSPWSPDSKHLALVQTVGEKYTGFKIRMLDCTTGRSQVLLKAQEPLGHHLWSLDGAYYLFSGVNGWYLHTRETAQVRVLYECRSPQRHCLFDHSGERVVLLDGDGVLRVLECSSLEEIATLRLESHLGEGESVNYSMIDPWENQVLLGVDVGLHLGQTGGRWLAVRLG